MIFVHEFAGDWARLDRRCAIRAALSLRDVFFSAAIIPRRAADTGSYGYEKFRDDVIPVWIISRSRRRIWWACRWALCDVQCRDEIPAALPVADAGRHRLRLGRWFVEDFRKAAEATATQYDALDGGRCEKPTAGPVGAFPSR